ncbi:MAG: hypothetical protein A2017_19585 [Lentisphaerae bacterium GWF2_44_16]|nr:MAG: hypothetical protein A2017_19585 [Lentisphaerae bacterium GWF2_44_16]
MIDSKKMFIKICGIKTENDYKLVTERKVSAVGFIAYPASPRYVEPEKLSLILASCENNPSIKKVAVFVNSPFEEIMKYISCGIDVVQLHGDEGPDFALKISEYAEVWKAIRPRSEEDVRKYTSFPAKKFLIDAFSEKQRGGTGKTADRELARLALSTYSRPVILAGGLNPENVYEAVKTVKPYGIDVSSGVEISPGVKDFAAVDTLIVSARKAFKEIEENKN